jgi:phage gp29-like protein
MLPQNKFLIATQEATDSNPYGFPDLSCVYWYVIFKKGNIKFWIKFIEKYGMPWTIAKTPAATPETDKDDLLEKIDNLREDGAAVINDDSNIEFIESSGKQNSGDLYSKFTDFCNAAISKAILGNTLTTENKEGTGSQALGNIHQKTAEAIINSDKRIICSFFNKLIKLIVNLQFGEQPEYPAFELSSPQEINETIAVRDSRLFSQGVRFTRKYYQKTYGLEEEDFDIAEMSAAAAFAEPPQIDSDNLDTPAFWEDVLNGIEKCNSFKEAKEKINSYIKEETPQELIENIEKTMIIGRGTGETA